MNGGPSRQVQGIGRMEKIGAGNVLRLNVSFCLHRSELCCDVK